MQTVPVRENAIVGWTNVGRRPIYRDGIVFLAFRCMSNWPLSLSIFSPYFCAPCVFLPPRRKFECKHVVAVVSSRLGEPYGP